MPFRGIHWSKMPNKEEIIKKIIISKTGVKQSKETIEKRVSKLRGRSYGVGRIVTKEQREKISKALKGKKPKGFDNWQKLGWEASRQLRDEKSHNWKGVNVGYGGLHSWVKRHLGKPDICDNCKKNKLYGKKIHWANKSVKYKRDLSDWIRLCVSCHWKYDKVYLKRKRNNKGKFI